MLFSAVTLQEVVDVAVVVVVAVAVDVVVVGGSSGGSGGGDGSSCGFYDLSCDVSEHIEPRTNKLTTCHATYEQTQIS